MKHKLLFMLFFLGLLALDGLSQNIQLVISPNPSPYISDWRQRTETASLIISNTGSSDLRVKIKTEIMDGKGALVATTEASKMPVLIVPPGVHQYNPEDIFPLNAVTYKGKMENSTARTGRIPDDNYSFCVTLTDPQTGAQIGTSGTVCKIFNIMAYQAPILISPSDKEAISEDALRKIFFKWTPVTPTPKSIVIYRLQVFEVQPGQEPMTALRSNQAIVEKDIRGMLQTQWPIEFSLPEKGKQYVWTITPYDDQERKLIDGLGFAQPFSFKIQTQYIIQLDSLKVLCGSKPGQYTFSYIITNQNTSIATFQNISINTSTPGGATISSYTPALGTNIPASGGTLTVSGILNAPPNLSYICIQTKIQKQGDPGKNAEDYLCDSVKPCGCNACDENRFTLNAPSPPNISLNNTVISFNQPLAITTTPSKTIKKIYAELVYFELIPENQFCMPCNKDAALFGHFATGNNSMQWVGPQTSVDIKINFPQITPCCKAGLKWCIRYKIEFTDCTSCSKLVCYKKEKEGCQGADNNNHNQN